MSKYKKLIIENFGYECSECLLSEWRCKPISLELDHIDGNNKNNDLSNLRLLCPNCHSQTETFRGRNIKGQDISDDTLTNALKNSKNIRQALLTVGLSPKGANYKRASDLLNTTYTKTIDIHNSQFGTIWINNGINNKKIKKNEVNDYQSVGWDIGRIVLIKPPTAKDKMWITNGIISKLISNLSEIPENWWKGRSPRSISK